MRRPTVSSRVGRTDKHSYYLGDILNLMRALLGGGERATRKDRLWRALDLTGAACAILFMLPLLACLSALIACQDSRPVIVRYRLDRKDGSYCSLLKFRTQRDAQRMAKGRSDSDPGLSGLGAILQTTGLDGLPALFNVFTGELPICGHYSWRQLIDWLSTSHTDE
jgi:lipopolysaccharide/colanic/teichoic acid biosynthesis glycosyltransferase